MTRWNQFSLRSLLLLTAILAISLAAIIQVPHVFVFALSGIAAGLASFTAYRARFSARLRLFAILAAAIAWTAFYLLSLGPFIALSELDRKLTGSHHLGQLAGAYLPAMRLIHTGHMGGTPVGGSRRMRPVCMCFIRPRFVPTS